MNFEASSSPAMMKLGIWEKKVQIRVGRSGKLGRVCLRSRRR
jgi:hypothetical protein